MKYNHIIISGGGIKGISIVGAIQQFFKFNDINNVNKYSGSSAGAIISLLLIIGYTPTELKEIFFELDFAKFRDIKFTNIMDNYGFDNGDKVTNLIRAMLITKNVDLNITFIDIYNKYAKEFNIPGSCITKNCAEYFNHYNTPNMKILEAIRITISYPLVYTPITLNDNIYVDGALIEPYPNRFVKEDDVPIGFVLDDVSKIESSNKINSLEQYCLQLINSSYNVYLNKCVEKYRDHIIFIKVTYNISAMNFNLDDEIKNNLYYDGINSTNEFIVDNYKKRKYFNIFVKNLKTS